MLTYKTKKVDTNNQGQTMMEFGFSMLVILLMIYGTIMIFRWTGLDLVERRMAHDATLVEDIEEEWGCLEYNSEDPLDCIRQGAPAEEGPLKQLDGYFYKPIGMNAVWEGDI